MAKRVTSSDHEAKAPNFPSPEAAESPSDGVEDAEVFLGSYKNSNMSAAKNAKNDEFYTQWTDIEREMNAYLEFDPDVFRDKVVLLPCDDPEWSNFAKFFALHFTDYGLKKLISTSYAPDSKPATIAYEPTLFEVEDPKFDAAKTHSNGKKFVLERKDINGDGIINIEDLQWEYLEGDGDFRSEEVTTLRNEADVVITNPPFSLFREFVNWLIEGDVKFSIIGGRNSVTTKDIFALIKDNKLWLGKGFAKGDAYFRVPESARTAYAAGVYDASTQLVHFRNTTWFTNIEHGRRHEPLKLMTMADNIRFSKHKSVLGSDYRRYDNYDAIDVPFTDAIPSDYDGMMGVPISFLDKHNPDQFEIISLTQTWSDVSTKTYPGQILVHPNGSRKAVGALNSGPAFAVASPPTDIPYYEIKGEELDSVPAYFTSSYKRILIRRKSDL